MQVYHNLVQEKSSWGCKVRDSWKRALLEMGTRRAELDTFNDCLLGQNILGLQSLVSNRGFVTSSKGHSSLKPLL